MNNTIRSLAFWGLMLLIQPVWAQEYRQSFGFKSDNDTYLANGQDRYYTNGLFISYRRAIQEPVLKANLNKKIYQLEIGQKMFNAQSGYIPGIQYVDRPITAYLYGGASMEWFYESESWLKAGVEIGTIGPAALGRQAQELVHRITGLYSPKGWEYQLNNEMGMNMNLAYTRMIQRSPSGKMDLMWNGLARLGTHFSGAGLGFTLRAGKLNQLFQTAYARSNLSGSKPVAKLTASEFFFFARPQIDLVVYDASISGGMFRKDKGPVTFSSKPWVLSQEFGLVVSKNRWMAQLSYTFKTPEVSSPAGAHQYGSISTYYHFN